MDPAYTEIQRLASERGISFDDARLLYAQNKNLEAGEYPSVRAYRCGMSERRTLTNSRCRVLLWMRMARQR